VGKSAEANTEIASAIAQPLESRGETILVVEDEDLLRTAVSKTLRKKGFSVVEASDGSAALDLIRANKNSINVVLLDVTLPGISSREVLEETQRIRPGLKVVLTSAYGKETVTASFAGLRVEHFIQKPFQLDDLVAFLQGLLAS
jgi:two-component system cell cycle sensor histidine kinase/response regulator CckA